MTRAKISTHKGVAEQTFTPAHITIFASDLSDLSENVIMQKVCTSNDNSNGILVPAMHSVLAYLPFVCV